MRAFALALAALAVAPASAYAAARPVDDVRVFAHVPHPGSPEPIVVAPDRSVYVGTNQLGKGSDEDAAAPSRVFKFSPAGRLLRSYVLRDEIFGPVLAVERVASVGAACDVLDDSPFALTGGLFSRNPAVVEEVVRRTPVGNLYVNRHITGAMVGRQPFGGNRRSGIGSKAGGPDYLLQFLEPRTVSENTLRQGFAPDGPEEGG